MIIVLRCSLLFLLLAIEGCAKRVPEPPAATTASPRTASATQRIVGPLTEADAAALATMNDSLRAYLALHDEVERSLPKLPAAATPQQIDTNQREFERRLRERRASAKPGDLFTAEAKPVILRLLRAAFAVPERRQLLATIRDENTAPGAFRLAVNVRYPDAVPLTTVPLEVLQALPRLTEDLEYRFVGRALILLDTHAHIIADYIENALPA